MTNIAKETEPLKWTGAKEWGSVGNTYRAEADGWKYVALQPRKGDWTLRGWGPEGQFLYREDNTLKGCKAQADDHQAAQQKTRQAADAAMQIIPAAAQSAAAGLNVMASFVRGIQGSARKALVALQPCGCPTTLHTMRCGAGGRVKVVSK